MMLATVKYTTKLSESTIVEINGAAIMAGSNLKSFATNGNTHANTFDMTTVATKLSPITRQTIGSSEYIKINRI